VQVAAIVDDDIAFAVEEITTKHLLGINNSS